MMKYKSLILSIVLFHSSTQTMTSAHSYRDKYAAVLDYYSISEEDSLKYKAALFLIDNMHGHYSPEGEQINSFKNFILTNGKKLELRELNQAWNMSYDREGVIMAPDSSVVTNEMLISNIDTAFDAWQSAPWHEDINFDLFCNYILPYRCSSEHLGGNWRKAMKEMYGKLILNEKNMAKAFATIKKAVFSDVILSNAYCPYALDAITCQRIGKAECGQRCILLVDALRALGIPAAIDNTPMWADYSNKSHGWVAVIGKNGATYTVFENDTIAKTSNPIDASVFIPRYKIKETDRCPYLIKQTKTPIKVYREEFAQNIDLPEQITIFKINVFFRDVSDRYGLNAHITLDINIDKDVYLCAYLSSKDWMPIAQAKSMNGKVIFENIGKNSVCTAYINENGVRKYITPPFFVGQNGIEKFFSVNTNNTMKICINRKYPLCQYTIDTWGSMEGGTFLGANNPDFCNADTLASIKAMPYGIMEVKCYTSKKYRFFRYKAPNNNRSSLSELQFYTKNAHGIHRLQGIYTSTGIDNSHIEYLYDDNTATSCRGLNTGYSITLDVGEEHSFCIDNIRYAPSTDLNFVEKGHFYELYYFDYSWKLVSRKLAEDEFLIFNNVPVGALLLLKDKTTGQEERIFEYKEGSQIWH